MSDRKTLIVGHRGAKGLAPENTLEGFEVAIQHGVDMIETDAQLTKDGVVVLLHKFNTKLAQKVERLHLPEEKRFAVHELDFEEIRSRQPDIPTLEEAIELINRRTRLMIEVKKGVPTGPIIEIVQKYLAKGWLPTDFMFNSAYYDVLKELMDALPDVERVIQGNWSGVRVQYLARRLKTDYILLDQRYLWWGYVYLVSKKFKLFTYTYPWHSKEPYNHFKAGRWVRYGLYGIITDYPDHFIGKRNTTPPDK
jgi:glycerophosphoryl diester phosphodiesterase